MDQEAEPIDKIEYLNSICNLVDSHIITAQEGARFVQPVINSIIEFYKEEE